MTDRVETNSDRTISEDEGWVFKKNMTLFRECFCYILFGFVQESLTEFIYHLDSFKVRFMKESLDFTNIIWWILRKLPGT